MGGKRFKISRKAADKAAVSRFRLIAAAVKKD
jgi:hypothetical protein